MRHALVLVSVALSLTAACDGDGDVGAPCRSASECTTGACSTDISGDGLCVPGECTGDDECPAGRVCATVDGVGDCVTPAGPGASCVFASDSLPDTGRSCVEGMTCVVRGQSNNEPTGLCVTPVALGGTCESDFECGDEDFVCDPRSLACAAAGCPFHGACAEGEACLSVDGPTSCPGLCTQPADAGEACGAIVDGPCLYRDLPCSTGLSCVDDACAP